MNKLAYLKKALREVLNSNLVHKNMIALAIAKDIVRLERSMTIDELIEYLQ